MGITPASNIGYDRQPRHNAFSGQPPRDGFHSLDSIPMILVYSGYLLQYHSCCALECEHISPPPAPLQNNEQQRAIPTWNRRPMRRLVAYNVLSGLVTDCRFATRPTNRVPSG